MKTTDELKEEVLRRCCTGKHIDDELDELLTKAKQEGRDENIINCKLTREALLSIISEDGFDFTSEEDDIYWFKSHLGLTKEHYFALKKWKEEKLKERDQE